VPSDASAVTTITSVVASQPRSSRKSRSARSVPGRYRASANAGTTSDSCTMRQTVSYYARPWFATLVATKMFGKPAARCNWR
jgi:hypothetical protein